MFRYVRLTALPTDVGIDPAMPLLCSSRRLSAVSSPTCTGIVPTRFSPPRSTPVTTPALHVTSPQLGADPEQTPGEGWPALQLQPASPWEPGLSAADKAHMAISARAYNQSVCQTVRVYYVG